MSRRHQAGFTLLELLVTVAVIALVSSMGMLALPAMIDAYRLRQAGAAFAGAVREAQVRSVREGKFWRLMVDADGTGYTIQSAASTVADPADCGETAGWSNWRNYKWPVSVTAPPAGMSRPCVTFGPTGRAEWPSSELSIPPGAPQPVNGVLDLPRLTDGIVVLPPDLPPVLSKSKTVLYYTGTKTAQIIVDTQEVRRFSAFCIGLLAYKDKYLYPKSLSVEAASGDTLPSTPSGWTTLPNLPAVPRLPSGQPQDRQCMKIPVNGDYRFFRISIVPELTRQRIVLDEINMDMLFFTLNGTKKSIQIQVSPVTGHVQLVNVPS